MKLLDVLTHETIITDLQARDKMAALEELVAPLARQKNLPKEELMRVLLERERLGSTGIGDGIAIPHGKLETLPHLALAFGKSRRGVSFDSLDNKPVHLFFVILTPLTETGLHLQVLARISRLLRNASLKEELRKAASPERVCELLSPMDEDF
ncbi:PTS sugar transporter subunit IIA [Desulfobotulus sp.]|jgi:PTS system nitrogen regulatory IIA component|uniref:PTS sugar transporter subunit IIA n=1 Tax=Desulfobotulus sp. TaxID=1940337 RepID=UPI002A3666E3|nr:PTS sugar transporter subunit IIA [Desulfobotulus sp.]MDY0163892.1 PTS sugar transporter subunit IIA [Desulfobotulus sp.]